MTYTRGFTVGHVAHQPLLGLLSWYPVMKSRLCNSVNTLRLRQDGRHFPDGIFICIFLNENEWHLIKISLKFVPKFPINDIPALVQIMAWRGPGDKPYSEPMMVVLPTHICVIRPQWVQDQVPVDFIYGCPIFKWVVVMQKGVGIVIMEVKYSYVCLIIINCPVHVFKRSLNWLRTQGLKESVCASLCVSFKRLLNITFIIVKDIRK